MVGCGKISRSGLMGCVLNVVLIGCHPPIVGSGDGGAVRTLFLHACLVLLLLSSAAGPLSVAIIVS